MLPVLQVKQILANDCDDVISHPLSARFSFLPFFCFFLIIVIVRGVFLLLLVLLEPLFVAVLVEVDVVVRLGRFSSNNLHNWHLIRQSQIQRMLLWDRLCPIRSNCVAWIGSSCVIYCDRAAWKCSCSLRHFDLLTSSDNSNFYPLQRPSGRIDKCD